MVKRLFLSLLFLLLFTANAWAGDYWVYIRTFDKPEIRIGEGGRSKKGDIVDIVPIINPSGTINKTSEKEKNEWAIIKVTGLTKEDIKNLTQVWEIEDGGEKRAYRRYKLDVDKLKLKKGLNGEVSKSIIIQNISPKTEADLRTYRRQARWYAIGKPFRYFGRKTVPYAEAAETVSVINSEIVGDDYETLTLWEDAKDGNITAGNAEAAKCYDDDGLLTEVAKVAFTGWTTDADSYIRIYTLTTERVPSANALIISSGASGTGFRVTASDGYDGVFEVNDGAEFFRVEGVQVDNTSTNGMGVEISADLVTGDFKIDKSIAYTVGRDAVWVPALAAGSTVYMSNTVAYSSSAAANTYSAININDADAIVLANNCTFWSWNQSRCVWLQAGSVIVNNCIGFGNGAAFTWSGAFGGDYNADDENDTTYDADGANSKHNLTIANELIGFDTNFKILSTSTNCKDGGTDLSAGNPAITDDFFYTSRIGLTYDIGANEYVAAGGINWGPWLEDDDND